MIKMWLYNSMIIVVFTIDLDTLIQARKASEESDYSASEKPLGKGYRSKFPSAAAAAATTSKNTPTLGDISSSDENDNDVDGKKPGKKR